MKKSVIYFGNESYFVFGNRSDLFSVFGTKKMPPLNKSGIKIDRKILAEIAYDSPEAFKTIVQKAQTALN